MLLLPKRLLGSRGSLSGGDRKGTGGGETEGAGGEVVVVGGRGRAGDVRSWVVMNYKGTKTHAPALLDTTQ